MKILNLITTSRPDEELRRYLQQIRQPYYFYVPGAGETVIKGDVISSNLPVLTVCQTAGLLKDYDYTLESLSDTCINFLELYRRLAALPSPKGGITGPFTLTPVNPVAAGVIERLPRQKGGYYRKERIVYNDLAPKEKAALLDLFICIYNTKMIEYYTKFVGRFEKISLLARFKVENFVGTWYQVATSASTLFLGTGPNKRAVQAIYTVNPAFPGGITVENSAINETGQKINITGLSLPRSPAIPVCRTVQFAAGPFGSLPIGDYWIVYLSPTSRTLVVGAPLITNGELNDPRFGLYVLARDRKEYATDLLEQSRLAFFYKKYGYTQVYNAPIPTP